MASGSVILPLRGHGLISSLLPSLVPASVDAGSPESFTAVDGTLITALVPPWTKHTAGSTNTVAPSILNNRIVGENAGTVSVYYRADVVPVSADYAVSAAVVRRSADTGRASGVCGRMDTSAATYYLWRYGTATNSWELYKVIAGTPTLLTTAVSQTLTADQDYLATLDMRGPRITGLVDGVPIVVVTDASVTAAGRAGLRLQTAMTSTTGVHLDNWRVVT